MGRKGWAGRAVWLCVCACVCARAFAVSKNFAAPGISHFAPSDVAAFIFCSPPHFLLGRGEGEQPGQCGLVCACVPLLFPRTLQPLVSLILPLIDVTALKKKKSPPNGRPGQHGFISGSPFCVWNFKLY